MSEPDYLKPYVKAARQFAGGFGSLLWASRKTQATRFKAIIDSTRIQERTILDAGCGRADLLTQLLSSGIMPAKYIGIEAVKVLADETERKLRAGDVLVRGDFVSDPPLLDQQADVIVFSGSLNTLPPADFFRTLAVAWNCAVRELAFNFLCSPDLAAKEFLHWYRINDIREFASALCDAITVNDEYIDGDCLVVMRKKPA